MLRSIDPIVQLVGFLDSLDKWRVTNVLKINTSLDVYTYKQLNRSNKESTGSIKFNNRYVIR